MSNLIEQLGGYDKAKETIRFAPQGANFLETYPLRPRFYITDIGCNRAINIHLLRDELLEFRRANIIYEKGDKITIKHSRKLSGVYVVESANQNSVVIDFGNKDFKIRSITTVQHATDEEIAAGKRL